MRNMLAPKNRTILCFERETICFDNLASINPQLILLRTDSSEIIWRFILAMNALKIDSGLFLLSSMFNVKSLNLIGLKVILHSLPNVYGSKLLSDNIDEMLIQSISERRKSQDGVLLGSTPMIISVSSKLPSLIQTSDTVLIEGEKGTGKESLAKMMAQSSDGISFFIKIDCEAIAAGLEPAYKLYNEIHKIFQSDDSQNGPNTILLSKIDHLDLKAQSEILLLLEKYSKTTMWNLNHHADLRFIATSESDLASMVQQNRFRKDLFYRLNVIPIHLPALRERKDDIPLLMDHFAIQASVELKRSFMLPTPYLSEQLCTYHWPGNLDELRSAMNRWAESGDETKLLRQFGYHRLKQNPGRYLYNAMRTDAIPDSSEIQNCLTSMDGVSLKSICSKFTHKTEKKLLRKALEITNWNRKKAAALLHISYKSMLNKMKMYEII